MELPQGASRSIRGMKVMFRFGSFRLDPGVPQLLRDDQPLKIEKIPLEILTLLIQGRDRVVSREEIVEAVWGKDKFVEATDGINTAIRKIRRVLDDHAEEPRYVGTVYGRGYRFLADVQVEGEEPTQVAGDPVPQAAAPQPDRTRSLYYWTVGAVLAGCLGIWFSFGFRPPANVSNSRGIVRLTSDNGFTGWPDLSQDGKFIAYASNRADPDNFDVYIQAVEGGPATRLTHEPSRDIFPVISPKDDQVAFQSDREPRGIYAMPIFGGEARLIAKGGYRPRYSPDGQWVAYAEGNGVFIVPASGGGEPRQLRPELSSGWPVWAGNDFLIFIGENATSPMDWWVTPRDGSWVKPLGVFPMLAKQPAQDFPDSWQNSRTPDYWDNGSVVFRVRTRDGANLWRIRFSAEWKPSLPERVTAMADHVREPTGSANGRLAAAVATRDIGIYELLLDANTATVKGKLNRLTEAKTSEQFASVTSDGTLVSYTAWRKGDHGDQYLLDRRTGMERQLTDTAEKEAHGRISPDGKFLVFGRWDSKGKLSFHRMALESGEDQTLCADCEGLDVTADGASYTYNDSPPKRLFVRDFAGGPAGEPLHDDQLTITQASLAAGNRWIVFAAFRRESPESEPKVFVAPFRRDGRVPRHEWVEIAVGLTPLWSPNGQWIYFDEPHGSFRCLSARRFDPVAGKPVGEKVSIAHLHGNQQLIRGWPWKDRGVARDRIVFSTMEMFSNVWMLR